MSRVYLQWLEHIKRQTIKIKKEMILRTSKTFAIPKAIFCIIHLGLEK